MPSLSSQNYFKKGLAALVDQNYEDASVFFRRALDLDRERDRTRPDMRYLSYYGLSLAKAGLSTSTALEACRRAASTQALDPVLFLNLGRVYLIAGKRALAAKAFESGLRLAPDSRVLRNELAAIDQRRRPVLPALSRDHLFNRWLGRARATLGTRAIARPVLRSSVQTSRL